MKAVGMKEFTILNDAKFFAVGLEQCQRGKETLSYMRHSGSVFLDALGSILRPKIKAVFLTSTATTVRLGLYTQDQGRRPGRKREVPNTYKIGGLVVDKSVAPECGIFECCLDVETDLEPLPTFSTSVMRIIRTDGKRWQVLARDTSSDSFTVTEEYLLPDFGRGLEWAFPKQDGALFDAPQELYGFIEFLRRALITSNREAILARTISSYGRELVYWLMSAEDTTRLECFVHDFCPNHNLRLGTSTTELQAAKILTYCMVIDAVMAGLVRQCPSSKAATTLLAASQIIDWCAVAQCTGHAVPTKVLKKVVGVIRENQKFFLVTDEYSEDFQVEWYVDGRSFEFCSLLWAELGGGNDSLSGGNRGSDSKWASETFAALERTWLRKNSKTAVVNIGGGTGNCAIEAARTVVKNTGSIQLFTGDPDLIAFQTMRFRLFVWRLFFALGDFDLGYQVSLGDPVLPTDFPTSRSRLIMFCDSLPRFPSGVKVTVDEFSRRLDLALTFIERHSNSIASLQVPANFLDGKEYAEMRLRLFDRNRTLWVRYDDTQQRPRDKRLAQASAIVLVDSAAGGINSLPEEYVKVDARPELQFSLMPPRLSGGYLSWPALTDIAAVPSLTGPIERRSMTLIDIDRNALAERVSAYLSPDIPNDYISAMCLPFMKTAGRFKAELTRRKIQERTTFKKRNIIPYPFRPFDERFAYLWEMRPLFSDPAPDLHIIASIPDNYFLLASVGDEGIGDGFAAWASQHPCDYDYFAGRSRHFPVWIPEALFNKQRIRTTHGGWDHPKNLQPKANLSIEARRYVKRLGYNDPDSDPASARLLWDYSLAVMYTPAYGKENQAALRLGWPHLPLPGWKSESLPHDAREVIEEYAALGSTIRDILFGRELEHQEILSGMATVRLYGIEGPVDPASLNEAHRVVSDDWGVPARGSAVRAREGAFDVRWMEGALMKCVFRLAEAMELPSEDCLERLGSNYANGRINSIVWFMDIPGAAWEFTIGGRKVLRKWLSYRDHRVIKRPLTVQEMEQFSNIARRLVVLTLLGIKLDRVWAKLLEVCGE